MLAGETSEGQILPDNKAQEDDGYAPYTMRLHPLLFVFARLIMAVIAIEKGLIKPLSIAKEQRPGSD